MRQCFECGAPAKARASRRSAELGRCQDRKDEAYITAGHLFRRLDTNGCMGNKPLTTNVVADLVRSFVQQAGLDPKVFAGHSLRAGFITSAAKRGASLPKIMRQSRHKSERMAMTYIRPATLFDDNAADGMADDEPEGKR